MEKLLFVSFAISFLVTFFITPYWIRRAKKAGLCGKDMHKLDKVDVAEMGGIVVLIGFLAGILFYVGIKTFLFNNKTTVLQIMALLATTLIVAIIGIIDDILGWKIGLRQWQKPVLVLFAALPMMVIKTGFWQMSLPLIGTLDLRMIYPLIIVPAAIIGAANGFNILAGYNGLEAGMGIIILSCLGFISWWRGLSWVSMIAFCMVFALLAFLYYNKYPSKVFPGDTLTYVTGAVIASVSILGRMEKIGAFLFIPYFIELILKARGGLKKESYAKLNSDGTLDVPYNKIYGLEHFFIKLIKLIKGKVKEKDVVYGIYLFELVLVLIVLGISL